MVDRTEMLMDSRSMRIVTGRYNRVIHEWLTNPPNGEEANAPEYFEDQYEDSVDGGFLIRIIQ